MYKKLYIYKCDMCEKKRQSFNPKKAEGGTCGKCLRTKVPEDQLSLFGDKDVSSVNK